MRASIFLLVAMIGVRVQSRHHDSLYKAVKDAVPNGSWGEREDANYGLNSQETTTLIGLEHPDPIHVMARLKGLEPSIFWSLVPSEVGTGTYRWCVCTATPHPECFATESQMLVLTCRGNSRELKFELQEIDKLATANSLYNETFIAKDKSYERVFVGSIGSFFLSGKIALPPGDLFGGTVARELERFRSQALPGGIYDYLPVVDTILLLAAGNRIDFGICPGASLVLDLPGLNMPNSKHGIVYLWHSKDGLKLRHNEYSSSSGWSFHSTDCRVESKCLPCSLLAKEFVGDIQVGLECRHNAPNPDKLIFPPVNIFKTTVAEDKPRSIIITFVSDGPVYILYPIRRPAGRR